MTRKRLAVLGQPISHSRSPAMHSAALAKLGLAPQWSYEAIDVAPAQFSSRVRRMEGESFVGANVTVPHKVAALELADEASDAARAIGAANTLTFRGGRIVADNTDAAGFLNALPAPPAGMRALVLGAGGAARAVAWALVTSGARVSVWNRTPERTEAIAAEIGASTLPAGDRELPVGDFDLLVNATSVGMGAPGPGTLGADLKALHIAADAIGETQLVVDLAYGPAPTGLIRAARERRATVVEGLEVLVRQGAASLRIWTGQDPPVEAMRRAAGSATWTSSIDADI